MPFPHRTIYFGVDSHGEAPPAHIRMQESARARPRAASGAPTQLVKRPEGEHSKFEEVVTPEGGETPEDRA